MGDRKLDLAPWPDYVDEKGIVHFKNNGHPESESVKKVTVKPDVLIFVTVYMQKFPFLDVDTQCLKSQI
jgi:dimethylaniline monooxygenase (N-oxide forming)